MAFFILFDCILFLSWFWTSANWTRTIKSWENYKFFSVTFHDSCSLLSKIVSFCFNSPLKNNRNIYLIYTDVLEYSIYKCEFGNEFLKIENIRGIWSWEIMSENRKFYFWFKIANHTKVASLAYRYSRKSAKIVVIFFLSFNKQKNSKKKSHQLKIS